MENIMCQGCLTLRTQSLKWRDRRCLCWDQQCHTVWPQPQWSQTMMVQIGMPMTAHAHRVHWVSASSLSKPLYIQEWARVGLQLWVGQTQLILVLLLVVIFFICITTVNILLCNPVCELTSALIPPQEAITIILVLPWKKWPTEVEITQLPLVTRLAEAQTGPQDLALYSRLPVTWHFEALCHSSPVHTVLETHKRYA